MIHFFQKSPAEYFVVGSYAHFSPSEIEKIEWLFSGAKLSDEKSISGNFIGPRKEMLTPWCSNTLDIFHNCGIAGVYRVEPFVLGIEKLVFDPMLQQKYDGLDQEIFTVNRAPETIQHVEDLKSYSDAEGLALSDEEIEF
ncbi:MAG: phosphoribosylformylglycinamidine synthase, partial [Cyclobacteriaceae bacterium]